jgi:hypothetical protein
MSRPNLDNIRRRLEALQDRWIALDTEDRFSQYRQLELDLLKTSESLTPEVLQLKRAIRYQVRVECTSTVTRCEVSDYLRSPL